MAPIRVSLLVAALAVASTNAYEVTKFKSLLASNGDELAALPAAQFSVPLSSKVPRSSVKNAMRTAVLKHGKASNYTGIIAGADGDQEYLTNITIGGQDFQVIVDTGSSDTWLAEEGFKCFNLTSYPEPQSECAFGPAFNKKASKTWAPVTGVNFNISYGDGEFLTGEVGRETVSVAGLTVTKQEIGLVNKAAWQGDGVNSGLMGLASPNLTSVWKGTNPDNDNTQVPYNPFFYTAVAQKAVSNPYFSVALNRGSWAAQVNSTEDPNLGYLAFGGIAPVPTTNTSVTVPLQGYAASSRSKKSSGGTEYLWYTVDIDSYIFNGSTKLTGQGKQAILDTGTTLNYLPTKIAKEFNALFTPPATFNEDEDTYYVDCNATAPAFTAQIGGVKFTVDPKDNILPGGTDSDGNLLCISGTQDGGDPSDSSTIYILGDVFLHNVVSTFNIKTEKVTLTQRTAY